MNKYYNTEKLMEDWNFYVDTGDITKLCDPDFEYALRMNAHKGQGGVDVVNGLEAIAVKFLASKKEGDISIGQTAVKKLKEYTKRDLLVGMAADLALEDLKKNYPTLLSGEIIDNVDKGKMYGNPEEYKKIEQIGIACGTLIRSGNVQGLINLEEQLNLIADRGMGCTDVVDGLIEIVQNEQLPHEKRGEARGILDQYLSHKDSEYEKERFKAEYAAEMMEKANLI